ncbi:hypothetical protein Tco_0414681 [Tanacetum coccineum]
MSSTKSLYQKVVEDTSATFLKREKLEQVVAIAKSCSPNALGDLSVTERSIGQAILEDDNFNNGNCHPLRELEDNSHPLQGEEDNNHHQEEDNNLHLEDHNNLHLEDQDNNHNQKEAPPKPNLMTRNPLTCNIVMHDCRA